MITLRYFIAFLLFALVFYSCDLNDYPPEIEDQEFDVEEYSRAGRVVGKMIAHDNDEDQVLTFEIIWASVEGVFDIDPSDGAIFIADSEKLVYEQTKQVKLTISVTDSHKRFPIESTAKATVQIIDLPDSRPIVLSLQPDGENGKDAILASGNPYVSYGETEEFHLYAWSNIGTAVNRCAIDFDLSGIPEVAIIDSAYISLYFNYTSYRSDTHLGDTKFIIRRIISDWEESTITWNTQPSATAVNQVLVDGATDPHQDFTDINITQLIRDYCQDMDNSYGLLLKLQDESPYRMLLLASSDHPIEQLRPKLDVYYSIIVK